MAMIRIAPDLREFLKSLNSRGVRWLLVGSWAVGFHGHVRSTNDLDVWVDPEPENSARAAKALEDFAFGEGTLDPAMFTSGRGIVRFGRVPHMVEMLNALSGVEFAPCWERRIVVVDDDLEVPLIALDDLLANKRASGRLKDLADVEELEKRRKLRP